MGGIVILASCEFNIISAKRDFAAIFDITRPKSKSSNFKDQNYLIIHLKHIATQLKLEIKMFFFRKQVWFLPMV